MQIHKHNLDYRAERNTSFNQWCLQHQEIRPRSLTLKADLVAKLDQCQIGATQVNTMIRALRSHPIALVEKSLQESTHSRSQRETLQCYYHAFILDQLKINECQAY